MKRLIEGGRLIDPANGLDGVLDLLIGSDGRIESVGEGLRSSAVGAGEELDVVDATGLLVLPGFIDLHAHLREPGQEYKEDLLTGARAAVAGGFTTVCCMANTVPTNDTGQVTSLIVARSKEIGLCRILPIGALSKRQAGEELAEIADMLDCGAVAISDDGRPVMNADLMRRALEYCLPFGAPISVHEEDLDLAAGGCMHEGAVSNELGLPGIPAVAEDVMVARDIMLAEMTGGRLHIAHISTAGAVALVREAQARGLPVSAEVTPHHFTLTDEAVRGYRTDSRMAPPLREQVDLRAMIDGLRDGTICAIATDHAPHSPVEKDVEFCCASNGITGLETAWGLTWRLVEAGELDVARAVSLLTNGPAECFGIEGGTLASGARADVTLVDPSREQTYEAAVGHSRSHNSPFEGWVFRAPVVATYFAGARVYTIEGGPSA